MHPPTLLLAHRTLSVFTVMVSMHPPYGGCTNVCISCSCPLWQSLRLEVRHWRHRHIRPVTYRVVSSATYQTDGLSKCSSWLRQAFIFFLLVSRGLQRIRHLADPWPKIFYRPVCLVLLTKVQWQHNFASNPPCCPASAIHFIGGIADLWVRHSSWQSAIHLIWRTPCDHPPYVRHWRIPKDTSV
jgi:hypothetical protein